MSFQMPRKIRVSETFCRVREKKGWLQVQAVWVIYNKLDCVNIEQGFGVGKILVLATLLCGEEKYAFSLHFEERVS
jgi:hypothetical protein